MNHRELLLILIFAPLFVPAFAASAAQGGQLLWYDRPADEWMTEALPIGNGRIGAMIFGGVGRERVQFNDKTLWAGSPETRGSYQNFGDVYIDFGGEAGSVEADGYRRELDIENAVAQVSYRSEGVRYTREYLASYPGNVIAMRFNMLILCVICFALVLNAGITLFRVGRYNRENKNV